MNPANPARSLALLSALFFSAPHGMLAAQQERINGPIEGSRTVVLRGHLRPEAQASADRGALEPWMVIRDMRLVLQPSEQQAVELERLLEEQRDPSSANYHNWLTPEEFGVRFGLSESDLGQITAWLTAEGFTVDRVARAHNWIAFSGSVEQLARTFRTQLHRFDTGRFDSGEERHFANVTEPLIPRALAGVVSGLQGLDDFRPTPQRNPVLHREFNGSSGGHYVAPDDMATIYDIAALYKAGFDGTGQKLVIAGQTNIKIADIRAFRAQFNLAAKDPQMVLVGTDPGVRSADAIEADLDIEWAGAVARNATIIYVYSPNVFQSVQYAIDQNLAPVISLSYGACEVGIPTSYRTMAQQANAQGITWLSASGDSGAAGCDAQGAKIAAQGPSVIFPASIPEVTAVGGTEFNEGSGTFWSTQSTASAASAMSYIPERAWNDTAMGSGIEGTGGGASTVYSKPWWQTGPGVPADKARDIPDVSLTASGAHDGYVMYANGGFMSVGGTSASTPSFAGIVSLLNQYVVAKGVQAKPGLGNINPTLYSLAQSTAGVFHDVTVGDNIVPCTSGSRGCVGGSFGYKAGVGYDMVTGLGSVDANNLVTKWASLPSAIGTTTVLVANPGTIAQTATIQLTATVTAVTGSNPPTGSVTFSSGSASLGIVTLVLSSGTTATATLTVNGSALTLGTNTISAAYTPQGNFAASTASATVNVTAPSPLATTTTVVANPTSITSTGTTQVTATVRPASGTSIPTGTVAFSISSVAGGSVALGSFPLANGAASLAVKGSSLVAGSNIITASFAANATLASSTGTVTVTVSAPPVATSMTVAANPASIASTATTQVTASVKASSGTLAPTGSVTFSVGNIVLGSAPVSSGTASLTVKGSSLAAGSNVITAAYVATGNFSNSIGSVTVTVTVPGVPTTTVVTANPITIAATGTTLLTATVKAATGTAAPTGSVTFTLAGASLGSALLAGGTASLTVKGSSLSTGSNMISASYTATGNFANSVGSTAVTVTSPLTATTTTLTAAPTSIGPTGSTVLTALVRAGSGSLAPTGTVNFLLGTVSLGSAPITTAGATFTVKGSSLASGSNVITASYSGTTAFAASNGSVTVTVTPASGASKVLLTVTPKPFSTTVRGWLVTVQLQEQAGVATTVSGFSLSGTDFSSMIPSIFGTAQLPARGTLTANLSITGSPLPANIVFAFSGVDASGTKWSQSATVSTAAVAGGATGK